MREHLQTFLADAARGDSDGGGVPSFVESEMRSFVECGVLVHGFARFRCDDCRTDRLLAFSCQGRGFCPSCGGRRMTARAAHLVDAVIPCVPTRQWVLSLPFRLRFRVAFDHDLAREVLAVFTREVFDFYEERARRRGLEDARTGSVTVIQRFGGALNLNPHFHTLCIDGVFTEDDSGKLRFHRLPAPADREVAELLGAVVEGISRVLERRGLCIDGEDDNTDNEAPSLHDQLGAASIQQLALTGPRAHHPIARFRSRFAAPAEAGTAMKLGRRRARIDGFDLHADTTVRARSRDRLERLCRYLLRPPLSEERLERCGEQIRLELKSTWRDGTTHLLFEPIELLERLAALVPRPHKNLVIYHGVLAGNARWRKRVIAHGRPIHDEEPGVAAAVAPSEPPRRANPSWAELMRRGLDIDALECPRCHGRLRFIAAIVKPAVVRRILRSVGLPAEPVALGPARAPPGYADGYFDVA